MTARGGSRLEGLRLEALGLACLRGERPVFSDLSFSIAAGEALVVTGPNGAGKSSLLRLVAGLIRPAAGSLTLHDGDPDRGIGEQAHYCGHLDAVKPVLSVRRNLADWQRLNGAPALAVDEALAALGLAHLAELPAAYASAGQRRRLALARLLVSHRPLWLLDEPTAALDAATQGWLAGAMHRHLDAGGMILAATHADLGLAGARTLELGR